MTIGNSIEDMSHLCSNFHDFFADAGLKSSTIYALDLALEEMITNIIKYGYDDRREHAIKVVVDIAGEAVYMLIEDDGHEFDPLSQNSPELDVDIADRQIGGVGIFLTLNMVNEINYSREDNKNKLRITVNL
jgi:anti-sigma regulatory factor (Ser/Thr protein kinase)